jgi:uncharacterized protein (DUF983 family)
MKNIFAAAITNSCPFCGQGKVFKNRGILRMPVLNHTCSNCKHDFTGEPGYYFGAMYVSYGIEVILGISTFLICRFLIGIHSVPLLIGIIVAVVALTAMKNYKMSRIFWLRIFPPDPNANMQKSGSKNI